MHKNLGSENMNGIDQPGELGMEWDYKIKNDFREMYGLDLTGSR
jgi:hypothetical protein